MVKVDKERLMRDLGRLFYGKDEETFSMEKFLKSITDAPVIEERLLRRETHE